MLCCGRCCELRWHIYECVRSKTWYNAYDITWSHGWDISSICCCNVLHMSSSGRCCEPRGHTHECVRSKTLYNGIWASAANQVIFFIICFWMFPLIIFFIIIAISICIVFQFLPYMIEWLNKLGWSFQKVRIKRKKKNPIGSGKTSSSLHGWMLVLPLVTSFCCFVQ